MKVAPQNKFKRLKTVFRSSKGNPNRIYNLPKSGSYTVLDSGCDQAMLGANWRIVAKHDLYVMDNEGNKKQLVDAIATVISPVGARERIGVIRVNHAMFYPGRQESLLPPDQMRWHGLTVDDVALVHGGRQHILGQTFTINLLWDGKTVFFIHTLSKDSDRTLPKSELTSSLPYRPRDYASQTVVQQALAKVDTIEQLSENMEKELFSSDSLYLKPSANSDLPMFTSVSTRRNYLWDATSHVWKAHQLEEWKKRLCCANDESVKKTFLATTQLVPSVQHENETYPKDAHISRFPMLSCRRLKEDAYVDVVNHEVGKSKFYSLLIRCGKSKIVALYPLGRDQKAGKTLEYLYEFCRDFGIPRTIISDYAQNLSKSEAWKRFTRLLLVKLKSSEPHKHNQNTAERAWQDIKRRGHYLEQKSGIPTDKKFALYKHICDCHNHTALASLNWRTPMEALDGETPDISVFRFYFWEPVWYLKGPAKFPERKWLKGRFQGIAWSTGDQMCYEICPDDDDVKKTVVHRSIVLPRHPEENAPRELLNHPSDHFFPTPKVSSAAQLAGRKRPAEGPAEVQAVTTDGDKDDLQHDTSEQGPLEKDLRMEYLKEAKDDEARLQELASPPADVLDHGSISKVTRHYHLKKNGVNNLLFCVETLDGEEIKGISLEDLKADAPSLLAKYILGNRNLCKNKDLTAYAKKIVNRYNKLIKLASRLERRMGICVFSKREPSMVSISHLAGVKTRRTVKKSSRSPNKRKSNPMGTYKYGVLIPRNVNEALELDRKNGNDFWRVAICKEIEALQSMGTFKLLAKSKIEQVKSNYQYAPLRMIFDVKQDLRRKARLVIGGHVVDSGPYDVYASTMKTISARILMLIASANKLDVLTGDIGNAYLYAKSNQKIYCRLGKEFNIFDKDIPSGSLATVEQALYGLPTSANRWHAHLSDTLRQMGFTQSRFDSDVWIRETKELYDYVGTHTDDLMVVSKDPREIMDALCKVYTIKKIQEPDFHLGCNYKRNSDGSWSIGTETYVKESLMKVQDIIGKTLGKEGTPMSDTCKPEHDKSELLCPKQHRIFQQLIGIAQWLITCGRLDLSFAINSLSRFSAAPREGHLKLLVRVFKYINQFPSKWIRIDHSDHIPKGTLEDPTKGKIVEWMDYYPDAQEEIDKRCPKPKGKPLSTFVYFDSNYAHDEVTRRSVTGTVTLVGNTPVAWMSKRQGAIATSTYSAELCAARQGTEEAINVRYMLRSLGVPVFGKTKLIGDNLGSLISATQPGSPCKKKHSAVAYHYVRECNAAGIIEICKIGTEFNLADAFTKALVKNKFWSIYKTIFE